MSTKPIDAEISNEPKPFEFSAFYTLVAGHAGKLEESEPIRKSWESFTHPTTENAGYLLSAQNLITKASAADYSSGVESLRYSNLGSVILKRDLNQTTRRFEYKLQMLIAGGKKPTVESTVALPTIVTAVRGGISLLAAAMAADEKFCQMVAKEFLNGVEFSHFESASLAAMVEESKDPSKPRSNSL